MGNLHLYKIQKFIRTYPCILVYQHNNLTVNQWSVLRKELKTLESTQLMVVKNSIVDHALNTHTLSSVFQGPCFMIGCVQELQYTQVTHIVNKFTQILLLGGFTPTQIFTHKDVVKLSQLQEDVYPVFLRTLGGIDPLYSMLQNSCTLQVLHHPLHNLVSCFEELKARFFVYVNTKSQSNRRFPYGYLVTTSLQLLTLLWNLQYSFFRHNLGP